MPYLIQRFITFVSLLLVVSLGYWSKYLYTGSAQGWVNNNVSSIFYELVWCLFFFLFFFKKKAVTQIPLWVFGTTCALEFLQLWKTPLLTPLRSTFFGRALLGTTFSPWDFLYYFLGCLIGWFWLRLIWQSRLKTQDD